MSFAHLLLVKRFFYSMLSSDWMEEIVSIDLVGVLSDFPFAFAWNTLRWILKSGFMDTD